MLNESDSYGSCPHESSASVPPWEYEDIRQLPYIDRSSPALSSVERDALPALWATRTNTIRGRRPELDKSDPQMKHAVQQSTRFEDNASANVLETPLTAPPPSTYNSSAHIPAGPKSAGSELISSPLDAAHAPATPPDSASQTSGSGTSQSNSPRSEHGVVALPGTMSSARDCGRHPSRSRNGSYKRQTRQKQPRIHRWKSAFKEIFTYHQVDESQFERIEKGHWTDEN